MSRRRKTRKTSTFLLVMAALLLWLTPPPGHARPKALKTEADVQQFTLRVMAAVGRGDLEAAYVALKNHSMLRYACIEKTERQPLP